MNYFLINLCRVSIKEARRASSKTFSNEQTDLNADIFQLNIQEYFQLSWKVGNISVLITQNRK